MNPSTVHFLIPYGPANQFLTQEIGRNSYANPGRIQTDISLEKGIGLSYLHFERGQLQLRAEARDIANHNNIDALDSSVSDIGSGNFLNRKNAVLDEGRSLILWAKVRF